jgi:hypothetical protein
MVEDSRDALPTYREIRPGSLDRELLDRMKRLFREREELLDVHAAQLDLWMEEPLSPVQHRKIQEGYALYEEGVNLTGPLLEMAENAVPIEDIMEMSDLEVGLRTLTGELSPDRQILKEPPPGPASTVGVGDDEVPGFVTFQEELLAAVDELVSGDRASDGGPTTRGPGRLSEIAPAVVFLRDLHEKTVEWDAEGTRVMGLVLRMESWLSASEENHRFFVEAVVKAPDPEHRKGALREIAVDLGLSAEDGEELAVVMNAGARLTFGEAFSLGDVQ